jgi:hypothetical protein
MSRDITFRIEAVQLGDHVHVHIWSGRTPGSRGRAGKLIFRSEEWEPFRSFFDGEPSVDIQFAPADSPLVRLENL